MAAIVPIVEAPTMFPRGSQLGVRFGHVADRLEYSASFYDGFNHLPDLPLSGSPVPPGPLEITRVFPPIRSYGADAAVPLSWLTLKAEAAYFTSPSPATDEYVLFVVRLEKQRGEWVFLGGYVGEISILERAPLSFDPNRG